MSSTRQHKVNSLIQREVSEYLLTNKPERLTGLLTITNVDVSPDLEHATVFFSVVGQDQAYVIPLLKKSAYEIQGLLNRKLTMRKVPRLHFIPDTSGEYADHITQLLKKSSLDARNNSG